MVDRLVSADSDSGKLPDVVKHYLFTGSGFGLAVPTDVTVFESVQAAADEAATKGLRLWATGAMSTSQTLVIRSDVDMGGFAINYTGTGVAVQLGDTSAVTWRLKASLPKVTAANKTSTGWAGVAGTTGVLAVNLNSCPEIIVPRITNFETGLAVVGTGQGNSYNTFLIGHLDNNKVNLLLNADATGWSNQNIYIGGRYAHNSAEGTNVSGVRHIKMTQGVPNPINGNTWIAPSVEFGTPEFHIDFAGVANVVINARYEVVGGARVRWQDGTVRCKIDEGYAAHQIVETFGTSVVGCNIHSGTRERLAMSNAGPVLLIENQSSSANAALAVLEAGATLAKVDPETAYAVRITAQRMSFKRASDAFDRVRFDTNTGRLFFGGGTATPVAYLGQFGTGLGIDGGSLAFATNNTYDIGLDAYRPRYVRAGTAVVTGAVASGSRPTASAAGAGASVFDTTLGKPIWSNGSAWVDSAGNTV